MESTTAIMAKQIMGIEQAGDAFDWRYLECDVAELQTWTLTLWGGHEVQIMAPLAGAMKIQEASERDEAAGREPLFTIRAAW